MTEWILILTMWRYNGGAAIEHVPFPTKQSCLDAGNAWIKRPRDYHLKDAICIERPAARTGAE